MNNLINATLEADKKDIQESAAECAEEYAERISRLAEQDNFQILVNKRLTRNILLYVFYSPQNIAHSRVDEHAELPRGTISKILNNEELECCKVFSRCYYSMKSNKDFKINQKITIEALMDPKFGMEYQKLTQPQDWGKQYIEKTENKTVKMEVKSLPDSELDQRIKQLEKRLNLLPDQTINLVRNKDGDYEPEQNDEEG